jgi:hypothetical protein
MPELSTADRSALVAALGHTGGLLRRAADVELANLKEEAGDLLLSDHAQEARHAEIDRLRLEASHVEWFLEWIGKFKLELMDE